MKWILCPLNDAGISSVNIDTDANKNTAFKTDVEEWHYPIDEIFVLMSTFNRDIKPGKLEKRKKKKKRALTIYPQTQSPLKQHKTQTR